MSEWKILKAKDFCYYITDGTHDSPKAKNEGKYLITSKHLSEYNIDFTTAKKISIEDYQNIIKRSNVEQWDILFSMIGTVGITYLEKNKDIDYACKNMGIFKFNGDKRKAYWLYYYLQSPEAKKYISTHLRGTTQQYIPLCSLRDFPVLIPPVKIQERIINILSSIDDKIELNNRINKNLEEQAEAIFKSWFVDFEPFGGVMPEDWHKTNIYSIARIIYG
ncbi:MAG: restriction endonuclease subunit S, partial [Ruminococcus sp.]|nr:restriction endonuclease subunit S [Ruminococcus sp.]